MKYIIVFAFGFYLGRRFYQNKEKLQKSEAFEKIENLFKKEDSTVKNLL